MASNLVVARGGVEFVPPISLAFWRWTLVFFIVSFDIIFELLIGFNIFGFYTLMPGRIASFFGDELVVGGFYHFISLLVLAFFINRKFSNSIILILTISIILISFAIGERANFIKLFLSLSLFPKNPSIGFSK